MRITFPLRDIDGVLVGISGRTVTDEHPKYKVYDTEFKDWGLPIQKTFKSHLLWNGHKVYPSIFFQRSPVIVVEGFKACMRVIQAGVPNVVAILGSKIAEPQKWLLERMASEVWLFLDNNQAGLMGTVIAGEKLGVPLRVVPYPDAREQPSDLSTDELLLALSGTTDFHRWLLVTDEARKIYQERRNKRLKYENRDWDD